MSTTEKDDELRKAGGNAGGSSAIAYEAPKVAAINDDIDQLSSRRYPASFEEEAGILSRIFFWYLNPIFEKGFKEPLELKDLGPPSVSDRSRHLYKTFMREYTQVEALKPRPKQSLWYALWRTVGYDKLWIAILLYGMYSAQQFGPVLILAALVRHLDGSEPLPLAQVWVFVALMLLLPLLGSVLVAHSNAMLAHVGVQFRNTLINVIYRKALRLSPTARAATSTGQIVNMFSAETLQVQRFIFFVNNLAIAPLQIAVALFLVFLQLGVATFVGLALIIIVLPSNNFVFDILRKVRLEKAKVTDRRVKIMNEVLNGIRIIKYYAWERAFHERVMQIRELEVRLLRKLAYIVAVAFTLVLQAVPVFMPVLTFYTFVALGNQLDAATAFTAISLFNLLQFPFVFLPLGFSQYNQTRVACDRILDLLAADELSDYVEQEPFTGSTTNDNADADISNTTICMLHAHLGWGTSIAGNSSDDTAAEEKKTPQKEQQQQKEPDKSEVKYARVADADDVETGSGSAEEEKKIETDASASESKGIESSEQPQQQPQQPRVNRSMTTLMDLSFRVQQGQLLAVVGSVGSGKSSLLTALLGEMILAEGRVQLTGSVAYCDQRPWIINDTVVNNVLFGLPYDEQRFDHALHAASLEEDLLVLPGGVNTQIGERGINLSGGQKARVSLARAIYRDADVYLLDDPLSAVDAHVGQFLFEEGICNALRGKTRVLVTHQVQLLPQCDVVMVLDAGRIRAFGSYEQLVESGINFSTIVPAKEEDAVDVDAAVAESGDEAAIIGAKSSDDDEDNFAVRSPTKPLAENLAMKDSQEATTAGPLDQRSFFSFYSDAGEVGRAVSSALKESDRNPTATGAATDEIAAAGAPTDGEDDGSEDGGTLSEQRLMKHNSQRQQGQGAGSPRFPRKPSFLQSGSARSQQHVHNRSRISMASEGSLDAALVDGDKLIARGKFVYGDIESSSDAGNLETIHFSGGSSGDNSDAEDEDGDSDARKSRQLEIEGISRSELKQRMHAESVISSAIDPSSSSSRALTPPGASIGIAELQEPMDMPNYRSPPEPTILEDEEYHDHSVPEDDKQQHQQEQEPLSATDDRGYSHGVVSYAPVSSQHKTVAATTVATGEETAVYNRQQSQTLALRSNEGRFDLEEAYRMHRQKSAQLAEKRRSDVRATTINTKEEISQGAITFSTYYYYFKAGWLILCWLLIFFIICNQAFLLLSSYWLAYWGDVSVTKSENGNPLSTSRNIYFLNIFAALSCLNILSYLMRSLLLANIRLNASIVLQEGLLSSTLGATVAFFDVTPIGRVLNRFSSDMNVIDEELSQTLSQFTNSIAQVAGAIAAIAGATYGIFLPLVVPLTYFYNKVQKYFRATSTRIARLESVSRSPIYADFSQALQGANTIRAYDDVKRFVLGLETAVDSNSSANVMQQLSQQWLTIRLDLIGGIVSFFVALLAVATAGNSFIPAGFVALGLSYSFQLTTYLKFAVRVLGQAEAQMNSVERLKYYMDNIEQEVDSAVTSNGGNGSSRGSGGSSRRGNGSSAAVQEPLVSAEWPERGVIQGNNVQLRYRDGPLVLKGLDFTVLGGEKVGIAGRTGSGKSSLMVGLFRIQELAGGSIIIDGVDISRLPLHLLRSKLGIIPQDPVMFSASVRFNLDPFSEHSDVRIFEVLENLGMKEHILSLPNQLQEQVAEGGDNFSAGQRQLICIVRAILRNPKILVLDEATASIDNDTDMLVQRTVREQFKNSTVLTIAHRLNTIIDSDKVMVMNDGKLAEMDAPQILMQKPDGEFKSLWDRHLQSHGQE